MKSIRLRLLAGLLGGMLLILVMCMLVMYIAVQDEVDELFDYQLQHTAYAFTASSLPLPSALEHKVDDDPEAEFVIQAWDEAGNLQFQSRSPEGFPQNKLPGFFDMTFQGERWRMFGATVDKRFVQVAQPLSVRNEVARGIAVHVSTFLLPLFLLAAIMIWFIVGSGLRPLNSLAGDVQRRSYRDLAPIDSTGLPSEIAPLAIALNDLMEQLGRVIKNQKLFIADAAHELLTPITALQLQIQLLSRANDEPRRRAALSDLRAGLARTIHLAKQLLVLARQDPDLQERADFVDLSALAEQVRCSQLPLAEGKLLDIELDAAADVRVKGSANALVTLIANLVDNAIKYTPYGGKLRITIKELDSHPSILVEDSGPGIPMEERQRVFDRFYRRAGASSFGSGLGLSIVQGIATRHSAMIQLSSSATLGGLGVLVIFGKLS